MNHASQRTPWTPPAKDDDMLWESDLGEKRVRNTRKKRKRRLRKAA